MASPEIGLEVVGLGHSYGDAPVLEGVSLAVPRGELAAVLGASGAGKSTLLRSIAGFVTPRTGDVHVSGALVASGGNELLAAERRGVGMVFQDYVLFPHMSVADNVGFGLHGWSAAEASLRVSELLELVGLGDRGSSRPAELSGGQQQRVALARALAPRPAVLLLDEPFANLDATLRRELGEQIRRLLAEQGVAGLLVTHDHVAALELADSVVVLGPRQPGEAATVLQAGRPDEVYREPATALVAELSGDVILLEGTVRTPGIASTRLGELPVRGDAAGAVTVCLRPEQMTFVASSDGDCMVERRSFAGGGWRVTVSSPAGAFAITWQGDEAPEVHARGAVQIRGSGRAVDAPRR